MCSLRLSALLILMFSLGGAAAAQELTKIDRTLKKEPVYTGHPKYCLLVFGPEARHRVWLVLDGDMLYVDRDGNGDLTQGGEHVTAPAFKPSDHPFHAAERKIEVGDIVAGELTHNRLSVQQTQYRRRITSTKKGDQEWQWYADEVFRQTPDGVTYHVSIGLDPACYGYFPLTKLRVEHFAWSDHNGHLLFANRSQDAPILNFGGPLTMRYSHHDKLRRGYLPERLTLNLGTQGLGPGSFVVMSYDLVPADVFPVVDIQFPAAPNQDAASLRYVLKQRC